MNCVERGLAMKSQKIFRRKQNMEKENEIEIIWATFSYKGSIENLKPAMEKVFELLPPTNAAGLTQEQQQLVLMEEEEILVGYD